MDVPLNGIELKCKCNGEIIIAINHEIVREKWKGLWHVL